jgi:hypothetical protein
MQYIALYKIYTVYNDLLGLTQEKKPGTVKVMAPLSKSATTFLPCTLGNTIANWLFSFMRHPSV